MLGFFALASSVMSEEKTIVNKVQDTFEKEWNEIVEYQKVNWEKGKQQTSKNWDTIKSFFIKVKNNVTQN